MNYVDHKKSIKIKRIVILFQFVFSLLSLSPSLPLSLTHTHTHTHIYIYIYIYLCVCVLKDNQDPDINAVIPERFTLVKAPLLLIQSKASLPLLFSFEVNLRRLLLIYTICVKPEAFRRKSKTGFRIFIFNWLVSACKLQSRCLDIITLLHEMLSSAFTSFKFKIFTQ